MSPSQQIEITRQIATLFGKLPKTGKVVVCAVLTTGVAWDDAAMSTYAKCCHKSLGEKIK